MDTLYWTPPEDAAAAARLPGREKVLAQRLAEIAARFARVKIASSLAAEDMVLTDAAVRLNLPFEIFTLNTGFLNAETEALLPAARRFWHREIAEYRPQTQAVDDYLRDFGKYAFYESVELRRRCCHIRKIEPLNRALAGADAWLSGQRRSQSVTRADLAFAENDSARGIAKFNPLFDWEESEVWAYVRAHEIPVNALYFQGYSSIGCAPCSRPIRAGEDIRAGRWWWEASDKKECGLHK